MDLSWISSSWRAGIEILILAVGIYFVLLFLRGTRGWSVVIGFLSVLLALTVITLLLRLQVLNLILSNFFTFFAVAVLVIFQPELRRLLSEPGHMQMFVSSHEQRETIEVIVQTCERLSDVRIGALLAMSENFQRKPLDAIALVQQTSGRSGRAIPGGLQIGFILQRISRIARAHQLQRRLRYGIPTDKTTAAIGKHTTATSCVLAMLQVIPK